MVWNNIGVDYAHLKLSSKSIEAYREAEASGSTLAMSNMAHKLIEAGFLKDAEEICTSALKIENYDKQIGSAIAKIKEIQDDEKIKEKADLEAITSVSKFFIEFGRAITKEDVVISSTNWKGTLCNLNVEGINNKFTAKGNYEVPVNNGLLGIANPYEPTNNEPRKLVHITVKYVGIITGSAIKGTLEILQSGSATILGASQSVKDVLIVVRDNLQQIQVFEQETQKFHFLTIEENEHLLQLPKG